MIHSADMQLFSTKHKLFWVVFLAAAAVCFALAFSGRLRRDHAMRAQELLRPIIAADTRFQNVQVAYGTTGVVILIGSVSSTNDLWALHLLVDKTELPSRPAIAVRVDSNPQ